jgi:hypothetical protein
MRLFITIGLFFISIISVAQTEQEKLTATMKEFHQALVQKDISLIKQQTDEALSYGHSNGWVETKADVIGDLETGLISYQSYKEDSVNVEISGDAAHIRFIADINATLRGNASINHIKVLEVWVKKGKRWLLFARQAVR